jgi:hypothetical protein
MNYLNKMTIRELCGFNCEYAGAIFIDKKGLIKKITGYRSRNRSVDWDKFPRSIAWAKIKWHSHPLEPLKQCEFPSAGDVSSFIEWSFSLGIIITPTCVVSMKRGSKTPLYPPPKEVLKTVGLMKEFVYGNLLNGSKTIQIFKTKWYKYIFSKFDITVCDHLVDLDESVVNTLSKIVRAQDSLNC